MASLKTVRYEFPYPSQDDPVNIHTDIQALAQKIDDKIFADVIKTSDLGTNVSTFLATPSSANLRAAVTDETGTGNLVFSTAPTFETRITISSAENNSIEIGRLGASSTPFIDFHSGATNIDYDSRIIANGGNGTVGQGNLSFIAADVRFTGTISFEGSSDDNFETTLTVTDPTADRIITFPDATGTVALTSQLPSTATSTTAGLVELFSDTVQTVVANAVTSTASRTYGIQVNGDGQAVVNVPWTDTNTSYTAGTGLTLTGTEFKVTDNTYQPLNVNLTAVALLNSPSTTGAFVKRTQDGSGNISYSVDTNTYLTSVTAHASTHESGPSSTDEIRGTLTYTDIANTGTFGVTLSSVGYGLNRMNRFTATGTSTIDIALPSNTTSGFAIGTQINFILTGATTGVVKFVAGSGATLNANLDGTSPKVKFNGQYAVATAIKTNTNEWTVFGNLIKV